MKIQEYVDKSIILAIGFTRDAIWRELDQLLKREGCNFVQAMTLIAIFFEKQGSITPSNLAHVFLTTPGNVSHCISSLEKRKLVRRELDQEDARSYQIRLMPDGRKAAVRLIKIIDRLESRFDDKLGKEAALGLTKILRELRTQ